MIRVLVVDDSPVARELLTHVLSGDPEVQVVGVAADGIEAIAAVARLRPDLVTMDITMPRMDGRQAIRHIMETYPTPIVVVTGHEITDEVRSTFQSLELGALAIVQRPPGPEHPDFANEAARILQTVKLMAEVKVVRRWNRLPLPARSATLGPATFHRARAVILGASTGGPSALKEILQSLPPSFAPPIIVVQHIAPGFVDGFASWLQDASGRTVRLARDGEALQQGVVYIPPEGQQLGFADSGQIRLEPAKPGELCPSASFTFRSAALAFHREATGVLLTGMGRDGAEGLLALRQKGSLTIAQDQASSLVFGMPAEAIRLSAAQMILPLDQIGPTLATAVRGAN